MKWIKKDLIYSANGVTSWASSHAMIPTPVLISEDVIRVYLTFCDKNGIGRVGFVDVDSESPQKILKISENPAFDIGLPGTFDENGVLQTCVVNLPDGKKYLYYAGFELGTKIRYRLLTGVAVSIDNGQTFSRIQKTPILERSDDELFFRGGPFVLLENNVFKLWYVAGSEWMLINNKEMPVYSINYLESTDGIRWGNKGKVCIEIENENEHGFGRPYVFKDNDIYKMFYSIRFKDKGYRIGYAESENGQEWVRKDSEAGIDTSDMGWDSETICYASIIKAKDKTYMFYNGNEFGKSGFGYAILSNK